MRSSDASRPVKLQGYPALTNLKTVSPPEPQIVSPDASTDSPAMPSGVPERPAGMKAVTFPSFALPIYMPFRNPGRPSVV